MAERIEFQPKLLHRERRLVTPLEVFRNAQFATGAVLSGGTVSGGGLTLFQVSSDVTVRMLNLEVFNQEDGWLEVEFRDGGFAGNRVMGPYLVQGRSHITLGPEHLVGRTFTSSIYVLVRSGFTAQPLSNGVLVNASFVQEPNDWIE